MVNKKDLEVVKRFKNKLLGNFPVNKIILFGSRAKGKPKKYSDFDIMIVSDEFYKSKKYFRAAGLYDYWNEDYSVDFLCLTKKEFDESRKKITITRNAVEEGIEI